MKTKKSIQFIVVTCLLIVAAGLLLPTLSFSEGCPPNDTCPDGWGPVQFSCWQWACDGPGGEGYCILCRKIAV